MMKNKIKNIICFAIIAAAAAVPASVYAIDYFNNSLPINQSVAVLNDSLVNAYCSSVDEEGERSLALSVFPDYDNSVYREYYDKYIKSGELLFSRTVPVKELNNQEDIIYINDYTFPWSIDSSIESLTPLLNIKLMTTNDGVPIYPISIKNENISTSISFSDTTIDDKLKGIFQASVLDLVDSYDLNEYDKMLGTNIAILIQSGQLELDSLNLIEPLEEESERVMQIKSYIKNLIDYKYEEFSVNYEFNSEYNIQGEEWDESIVSQPQYINSSYHNYWIENYNDTGCHSLEIVDTDSIGRITEPQNITEFRIKYNYDDFVSIPNITLKGNSLADYSITDIKTDTEKIIFSGDNVPDKCYMDNNNNLFYVGKIVSDIYKFDLPVDLSNIIDKIQYNNLIITTNNYFTDLPVSNCTIYLYNKEEYEKEENPFFLLKTITDVNGISEIKNIKPGDYILEVYSNNDNYISKEVVDITLVAGDNIETTTEENISIYPLFANITLSEQENVVPLQSFELYQDVDDNSIYVGDFTTDNNGNILIYNLKEGFYNIVIKDGEYAGSILHFAISNSDSFDVLNNISLSLTPDTM